MRVNFELLDLRAFIAVVELGNFRKAAEAMNLSQPAFSRRIKSLELELGGPLLERSTRHVAPTAFGREIEPLARRLIDEFENQILSISGVGDQQAGQVTIACIPTAAFYFLPKAIKQFNSRYPHIRFRVLDVSSGPGLDSVARGEAEFGINFIGASGGDLNFSPLIEDPFVLACRRDHPLAKHRSLTWSDLEDQQLIGVSRASGNRVLMDTALARAPVRLRWFYEVNHLSTSLGLVERGLGVSILPLLATPPEEHPLLMTIPIVDPVVTRVIGIVERPSGRLSPAAQRFRDMLVETWKT
ncbi:LysR family transcriptional regulator [Tropicimonas isoalkanivorans]|uniref:DNA-binding transcriptional regulator, LysR family n=1 Tax=Tropicimonas isoalkanivorans TaxID=441112 RepID=A0A1I1Q3G1_9RHOB|nr:LysR family transcriptional regulator [Tropicimonas isoalkanivorans]SFD16671.1 DNA-binding transcriptional regulator, LysR family [Tropicimonas isoalkanivorans]